MLSLRWALRINRWLPKPLARWYRWRRLRAIRKRDGDAVVWQRIAEALDLDEESGPDGPKRGD